MKRILETLSVTTINEHLLQVTLNRVERRNALNTEMGRDLRTVFRPLVFEPGNLRCVIITGAGDKAFCAGGDLIERNEMSDEEWLAQHAIFEDAIYAIMECAVPTIAAVNGAAYGGGCEIALACDFIYAAETARFAFPEVTLGIIAGGGGTQNLPRAVGSRRALELIMTGRSFSASEGQAWGIVNEICKPKKLMATTLEVARVICENAPIAVRQAKLAVHAGMQMDLRNALRLEVQSYNRIIPTEDRREGVRAFNERRKADFKGC